MLQQSIKVSLIAVSVEELVYLLLTSLAGPVSCQFYRQPFRDSPVHLEDRTISTKTDAVEGPG
jgi:hypothetical protein